MKIQIKPNQTKQERTTDGYYLTAIHIQGMVYQSISASRQPSVKRVFNSAFSKVNGLPFKLKKICIL